MKNRAKPLELHGELASEVKAKFLARVEKENENDCWIWQGSKHTGNAGMAYGAMTIKNKHYRAHRISWALHNGPIPEGLLVCHKCDVPLCVNPDHLFLGTNQDNSNDKMVKGRCYDQSNENNGNAKLTVQQVREIREKYIPYRYTTKRLSREYGVTQGHIDHIIRRHIWKNV